MSIRASLGLAVARCIPLHAQHATLLTECATAGATSVQRIPDIASTYVRTDATGCSTVLQQQPFQSATTINPGQELHVAFAKGCNTQPTSLTEKRRTAELIKLAMKRCDEFGDGLEARDEMRRQCLELPPHLQIDLLDHFRSVNNISRKDALK